MSKTPFPSAPIFMLLSSFIVVGCAILQPRIVRSGEFVVQGRILHKKDRTPVAKVEVCAQFREGGYWKTQFRFDKRIGKWGKANSGETDETGAFRFKADKALFSEPNIEFKLGIRSRTGDEWYAGGANGWDAVFLVKETDTLVTLPDVLIEQKASPQPQFR